VASLIVHLIALMKCLVCTVLVRIFKANDIFKILIFFLLVHILEDIAALEVPVALALGDVI
jgi:hypothetical protein